MATKKTSKKTVANKKAAAKKTSRAAGGGGKTAASSRSKGSGSRGRRKGAGRRKGVSVLLREVDPTILDILKARAEREGRSLQQELHLVLRREAKRNYEEALAIAEAWQKRLSGRDLPSSLELIREDRDR